jgi:hypothetical protein
MGHVGISRGTLGQIRNEEGMTFWSEITSLAKQLKTPIVKKSSRTCRATFGSMPPGTGGGVFTERQPCGKDVSAMWSAVKTVSGVGAETNINFTCSGLGAALNTYVPGMLVWLTGANAGRSCEVVIQTAGGVIEVDFDTMFPIKVGDTFKIRKDCKKWWEGANGCQSHFGADWVLHYRGEPYLKPQDSDSVITPGASVGRGLG